MSVTTISAKVVADSVSPHGHRITSMLLTFPRIILAEFNTHRVFSRNTASSRAIPFKKMLQSIKEDPFIPIEWQVDHSGMQGKEYLSKEEYFQLDSFVKVLGTTLISILDKSSKEYLKLKEDIYEKVALIESILAPYVNEVKTLDGWWLFARDKAIEAACILHVLGVTKQLCNRLLEPFMWTTVLCTATEFENFFELRCPKYLGGIKQGQTYRSRKDCLKDFDYENLSELGWLKMNIGQAEIHMMALAESMWDARNESEPKELAEGQWHIVFEDKFDNDKLEALQRELSALPDGPYLIDTAGAKMVMNKSAAIQFDNAVKKHVGIDPFQELKVKIATAWGARTSYTVVGSNMKEDYEKDLKLHDSLIASKHSSPLEHCARVMTLDELKGTTARVKFRMGQKHVGYPELYHSGGVSGMCRNFRGFIQYRHIIENGG